MSTNPQPDQPDSGPERFRQLFTMQMERPEEDLEMDRTALYLAGEEYPGLDVEGHLGSLDALAEEVAAGMTGQVKSRRNKARNWAVTCSKRRASGETPAITTVRTIAS